MRIAEGEVESYGFGARASMFLPDKALKAYYDRMFALYVELYPNLRETFGELARV